MVQNMTNASIMALEHNFYDAEHDQCQYNGS
jgi:hypothetical protein